MKFTISMYCVCARTLSNAATVDELVVRQDTGVSINTSTGCLDITSVPDAILSPAASFAHAAFLAYHAVSTKTKVARMPLEEYEGKRF